MNKFSISFFFTFAIFFYTSCASIRGDNPYFYYVMCKYAYLNQDLKSAEELCEKAKKILPKNRQIYKELMNIYLKQLKIEKFYKTIEEYLSKYNTEKDYFYVVELLLKINSFDKASKYLKEALKKYPNDVKLKLLKVQWILRKGDTSKESIEFLKKLLQETDKNQYLKERKDKIAYTLARIYILQRDLKTAIKILEATPAYKSKEGYRILLELYKEIKDYQKAEKLLKEVLKKYPKNLDALNRLFQLYVDTNQYEKAKEVIDKILKLNPKGKDVLLKKFFLYLKLGKVNEFIKTLEELKDKYKNNFEYHFILGMAYEEVKDYQNAIKHYEKAKQLRPENTEIYERLTTIYIQLKQYNKAIKELKQAIKLNPNDYQLYTALSQVYELKGNYQKVIQVLQEALKKFPNNPVLHYYLAIAYDNLNNWEKTEYHLKKALELRPNFPDVLNYLGYSYIIRNINIDKGIELVKKALHFQPDHPAYLDSLAWGLFKKGKVEKALEYMIKVYKKMPDDPVINYHYGRILEALGEKSKAKSVYEKALKLLEELDKEPEKGITKKIKERLKNLKW
ncbi:MAG TPA: tetratricopeptide repeat protein [Persephonella sp.]|nr:tetratricopeptide repeat protein [Persephonella sp.]